MKPSTKTTPVFSFTACIRKFLFYAVLFTPILFLGCDAVSNKGKLDEVNANENDVHVAFAGGGWRAHTGHSAWIISLLDNDSSETVTTLAEAFANVKTISSNSGGSWFSTMLMYSNSFTNDIQAPKAIETWASTGWIGLQKKHFDTATYHAGKVTHPCSHHLGRHPGVIEEAEYIKCVSDFYTGSVYYWKKVIDSLIFRDYPLGSMTLGDPKQAWAADKSLLIAASMLNNSVVLNKVKGEDSHQYYQACLQNATNPSNMPELRGDEITEMTTCSAGLPKDVAAVTFTSLGKDAKLTPLAFLRGLDAEPSLYNIGYTRDYMAEKPPKGYTTIQLPLNHAGVPVMTAAAASSAAVGFAASEHIIGAFDAAYTFEDEALSFKLGNAAVQFVDTDGMSLDDLVNNKVVRLADGGPVDNSGVAQMVSFLQLNQQADGFNIVAFDNVDTASLYLPGGKGASVGLDIASLFGAPDPFSGTFVGVTFKVETPQLQIFEADAMNNTQVTWSAPENNGQQIFYTRYHVKTVANEALGIAAGTSGTLHAFTCASPNAGIMPNKGDADFQAYAEMLKYIHGSLNAKNAKGEREGLNYLRQAFGMPVAR